MNAPPRLNSVRSATVIAGVWLALVLLAVGAGAQAPQAEPAEPDASAPVRKLLDEGAELYRAKKPAESLGTVERALEAAHAGKDAAGEAVTLRVRARLLQELRRDAEAQAAWRETAGAWERVGDGPGRIEALAALGIILQAAKPDEARELLGQAAALARMEEKRPLAAGRVLNAAAFALYTRGRLQPARELYTAALEVFEKRAPDSLDAAVTFNGLGIVAGSVGNLDSAASHLERARAIQERLAPDSLPLAGTLYNIGLITQRRGEIGQARELFRKSLAIREKLAPDSAVLAHSLNSLGSIAYEQADLEAAYDYFRRALAIQERLAPDAPDIGHYLTNLGGVALALGEAAQARNYFERGLAIREKFAPESLDVAGSLHNLGVAARHLRDLEAASGYARRALAIHERLAPDSLAVATNLQNLGDLARDGGKADAARAYYSRSIAIQERLAPSSLDFAQTIGSLGLLELDAGKVAEAEPLLERAWEIVRRQGRPLTGDEARQVYHASTASYAAGLIRCRVAAGKVREAFAVLEESRAQSLRQLLEERDLDRRSADPKLWARYEEAVRARNLAEQALAAAGLDAAQAARAVGEDEEARTPKQKAAVAATAKKLEAAQAQFVRARLRTGEVWAELVKDGARAFAPPRTADPGKSLPPETLLAAFSVDREQAYVFLLRSGENLPKAHPVAVSEAELEKLADRLLRAASTRGPEVASVGRTLFAGLFPGEAGKALLAARRVLIIPDGPLWSVPFAALVVNPEGAPRYLGAEKALSYAPSLSLLAQARADRPQLARGTKPAALVLGNPLFDRKGTQVASVLGDAERRLLLDGKPPAPLPGTGLEAESLSRMYGTAALTGTGATEAAVRARIAEADVVHVATHGFLHPQRPMSSGVLLTPPEKEPAPGETENDGALQAWEIFSELKLKAELVVLSACETGSGRTVRGEGIIGMPRALQYAGARSVVATRWKVADRSTAGLMVRFHEKLRAGLAKDEALRQAMATAQGSPATAHPYFWAAFFLTGDPDNPGLGRF